MTRNISIPVTDAYNRPLTNLRIAVTVECNYKCIFCHIEGEPVEGPLKPGSMKPLLTPEDYLIVSKAASLLGIESYKITGGEPLIRNDIVEIIEKLREGNRRAEISMTTNGYLLKSLIDSLIEAGLDRLNVSLHSLRRSTYQFITGVDGLDRVLLGIEETIKYDIPLKLNSVILKNVNDDEIWDLINYAEKHNAMLQLIELHPVGLGAKFFEKYYFPLRRVEEELLKRGGKPSKRTLHNRPIYTLPSGVKVEVVKPYGNPVFCMGCSRIRIGPFGDLSPCLNWKGPRPSLLPKIREGSFEERVLSTIRLLLLVNTWRRPFFLPSINDRIMQSINGRLRDRLRIPKKSEIEMVLEELKRQLLGRESQ